MSETPAPLFTAADLKTPLGRTVSDDDAKHAERIVWGWLHPILGGERPQDPAAEVYSWAVELGAIYLENPTGLSSYQLSQERVQYSAERRNHILEEARTVTAQAGADTGTAAGGPRGSFPAAPGYPDPARPVGWRW